MITRREFFQAAMAASAIYGASGFGRWSRVAAQQALTQDQLLQFDDFGNVTLIHVTDIHAQLKPVWFREPEINIGVGEAKGQVPHITGAEFQQMFGISPGSPEAYALSYPDFEALARGYGKMGGMDRVATVVKAIRAARPDSILLDGGDTWHGSMTSFLTKGQDMVNVMNALGVDAMTSHWEWTYGTDRVKEIVETQLKFPFLGANIFDAEWDEPAFEPYKIFEKGGLRIGVIGQAFPYMPIANPRWMFPEYSFGIREERMQAVVDELRAAGVDLVVVLSHNGFDVDKKMGGRIKGIDVILSGHIHRSMPFGSAQTLSVDDTYAITAFLLYSNGLVEDDFVLTHENFTKIVLPNADGFYPDDRAETEYPLFSGEPCMKDCAASVQVTKRAIELNVTPEDPDGRPAGTMPDISAGAAAVVPVQEAAPAEAAVVESSAEEAAPAETAEDTAPAVTPVAADPALIAAGEKVFKKCAVCHKVGEGAKNATGPVMNGIVGRPAGTVEGFKYSKPLMDMAAAGLVWDEASLHAFLTDPKKFMKGTKMIFAGLKKEEEELAAVIAYLATFAE